MEIGETLDEFEKFSRGTIERPVTRLNEGRWTYWIGTRDAVKSHARMVEMKHASALEWAWKQIVREANRTRMR